MAEAFEPKGVIALWRRGYNQLLEKGVEYGQEISHEELASWFGLTLAIFLRSRQPLYRVIRELEQRHGRTLVAVPGRGYRVAHPSEHADVCDVRRLRSRRQVNRAVVLAGNTDRSALSPAEAEKLSRVERGLLILAQVVNSHERRLQRIEDILSRNGMK